MKTHFKILILLLTVALFSCSKSDNGNSIANKNIRLKTYGVDAEEYNFSYNSNNQLTGFNNNISIIYNTENKIIQIGNYIYTYNTLGRLSEIDNGDEHADLVYNTQGLLARLDFRFINPSDLLTERVTRTFVYDSSSKLIEIEEKRNSDSFKTRELFTYDSNDNIVQVKKQRSTDLINYEDREVIAYTYDNKKNPNKLTLEKMGVSDNITLYILIPYHSIEFSNYAFFRALFFSNNNILTESRTSSAGNGSSQFNYTYNTDNYPIAGERIRTFFSGETITTYYTWVYDNIN